MELPLFLGLGAAVGVLAGLFGIGGGLIIVPALVFLFDARGLASGHLMQLAVGTSLATIVATAIASTYGHQRQHAVLWPVFARLSPGLIAGTLLGVVIADRIGGAALRHFFALFVVFVALQMALGRRPRAARHLPGRVGLPAAGAVIGTLSALVGIGGGTLTTPFLLWCNVGLRNAVATSAASGVPIALAGGLGYTLAGLNAQDLPSGSLGFVYWPAAAAIAVTSVITAPLGARLTHVLPVALLRRLFALLLLAVAWRMVLGE